jgi:RimJ/RimL family protein N-acetyltransferase
MEAPKPKTLEFNGLRLDPLGMEHADALREAVCDGELWNLRITSAPEPENVEAYIATALEMTPSRLPFVVIEAATGKVLGTTSYYDIIPAIDRVEIGYTWYRRSVQRTHVNTSCKLLMLSHAFEGMGCAVVGFRTDILNHASQAAIERLGAKKDGVIRHHVMRRDGTVRDTVVYSILRDEWPEVKAQLENRLARGA